MKYFLKTFITLALFVFFNANVDQALAANPAISKFSSSLKAENGKIRNLVNKTRVQRSKNKYQKAAAKKYTSNYDSFYGKFNKIRKSDTSNLSRGLSKYSSKSTVSGSIRRLDGRISKLENIRNAIAKDLKKIKKDKKKFWKEANGLAFWGVSIGRTKYNRIVFGVHLFGTLPLQRFSLKPGKQAPRTYKGGVTPEQEYLKKLSTHIGRIISSYKRAVRALKARQAKLAKGSKTKNIRKKPPAAPAPFVVDNDM